jgi:lysophospholipase L1-like esterase
MGKCIEMQLTRVMSTGGRGFVLGVLALWLANTGAVARQPFPNETQGRATPSLQATAEAPAGTTPDLAVRSTQDLSAHLGKPTDAALRLAALWQQRVVFLGDSITEYWFQRRRQFFIDNGYVARGAPGQTSGQISLRFQKDVVLLDPAAVLILAGTNDVAENGGPVTDEQIIGNLEAMVEIAHANKIKVVIGSLPPANAFGWNPKIKPAPRIMELNTKIKAWAAMQNVTYADFWSAMALPDGGINPDYFADTVHPNEAGFGIMEPIAKAAIENALTADR